VERFESFDGREIAYLDVGEGPAVVLLHGFAANHRVNWVTPGVVEAVRASGRRVLAPDARGHGESDKPHEPEAYAGNTAERDVRALLDHVGLDAVDVVGYSMGAITAARVVPMEPRTRALVLGGVGERIASGAGLPNRTSIADVLTAERPHGIENAAGRAFRTFADATGADRAALAALLRAPRDETGDVGAIAVPTLVIVGDGDVLAGPPEALAERIPGAVSITVQGDHLSAVNDPMFSASIVTFLDSVSPAPMR